MSAREAFRQRVSVYAVASKRVAADSDVVSSALLRRFGAAAATAWRRACAVETRTIVVEWQS